jgi:hypothetical protein
LIWIIQFLVESGGVYERYKPFNDCGQLYISFCPHGYSAVLPILTGCHELTWWVPNSVQTLRMSVLSGVAVGHGTKGLVNRKELPRACVFLYLSTV